MHLITGVVSTISPIELNRIIRTRVATVKNNINILLAAQKKQVFYIYALKMNFTDTHTHLFLEQFADDIDDVIVRAQQAGVQQFFLPNIDKSTTEAILKLANNYPNCCFPMMGLHPCSVNEAFESELQEVERWHTKEKFYAVGEIGIDLHWDDTFISQQKEAFRRQIELAKKLKLPIVIHVRESFQDVFEIIDELNDDHLTGIFHCFSGSLSQAQKIIDYTGFKLGIGGVLTYKNSGLDTVIKQINLQHIVLETDSPYLAPVPHRGERNESAHLVHIAEKLAEVKGLTIEDVANVTTANARAIFNL